MPCWYYDKKELRHTPSIKAGLSFEEESTHRREGARLILLVGTKMGLSYETMATGVVFFHRFYMVHTFQDFPRSVTACCCLFLSGKVEETPKKCRDIMKTAKSLMDEESWAQFGADPKEEVMTLERIILQTIKFDFIVEHPYAYLLKYIKCIKEDKKKLQNMVQMAWTFVNDSLCTTLCLQWESEIIAIALMYLACKMSKLEVTDWAGRNPKHTKWWDLYVQGITTELLDDICHQFLDLYAPNKSESGGSGGAMPESSKPPSSTSQQPPVSRSKKEVPPHKSTSPKSPPRKHVERHSRPSTPPLHPVVKEKPPPPPENKPPPPPSAAPPPPAYNSNYPYSSNYPPNFPPPNPTSRYTSPYSPYPPPPSAHPPPTIPPPPPPAATAPHFPPPISPMSTNTPPPNHYRHPYPSNAPPPPYGGNFPPPPTLNTPPPRYPPPSHSTSTGYFPPGGGGSSDANYGRRHY